MGKFFAYDPASTLGVTVAAAGFNADGVTDIFTAGSVSVGGTIIVAPEIKIIDGTKLADLQPNQEIADTALLDTFFGSQTGIRGAFVGGQ